jgi:hypothetical protein
MIRELLTILVAAGIAVAYIGWLSQDRRPALPLDPNVIHTPLPPPPHVWGYEGPAGLA